MRRSIELKIAVFCPHFQKPVLATRNELNEKLVDCQSKTDCVTTSSDERGVTVSVYPQGCPVFR